MIEVYEYNGKTYIKQDNYTLEVQETKQHVEENLQYYIDKINNFKGEIE